MTRSSELKVPKPPAERRATALQGTLKFPEQPPAANFLVMEGEPLMAVTLLLNRTLLVFTQICICERSDSFHPLDVPMARYLRRANLTATTIYLAQELNAPQNV